MRRAKLKQVVSAVHQLSSPKGVTQSDIKNLLRNTYGCGAHLDCKPALRAAVNEGFLTIKKQRFYPTTATNTFLEMRRRRHSSKRRGRRGHRRRSRGRHSSYDYILEARRRRRRSSRRKSKRGRHHDAAESEAKQEAPGTQSAEEPVVKQEEGAPQKQ